MASETSITSAAHERFYLERSMELPACDTAALDSVGGAAPFSPFFTAERRTATVRGFTVESVEIDSDTLTLWRDGRRLRETRYLLTEADADAAASTEPPIATSATGTTPVVLGANRGFRAPYHWITQCLPAIDWSLRTQPLGGATLALPTLEPWQEECIALLGHGETPRLALESGRRHAVPLVEWSEFLNGRTAFHVSGAARQTHVRLVQAANAAREFESSPSHGGDGIFVASLDDFYGVCENQAALASSLSGFATTVVFPEQMSALDRIATFAHARFVIGLHGNGMSHIAFCRPGTLVWELFPETYATSSHARLAEAGRLRYRATRFPTPPDSRSWAVDIDAIAQRMPDVLVAAGRVRPVPVAALAADEARVAATFWIAGQHSADDPPAVPIDELMTEFESLGENCEFGFAQRAAGAEPLGLLRLAGFTVPAEQKLSHLVAAIENGFEGFAEDGTVTVESDGPGTEFLLRESRYSVLAHTFQIDGHVDPVKLARQEAVKLRFLRDKLLSDLATGEKIWVWKGDKTRVDADIEKLRRALRACGPNLLLWVRDQGEGVPAGLVRQAAPDLLHGYVEARSGPLAIDIHSASWFTVCRNAYRLVAPTLRRRRVEAERAQAETGKAA